MNLKNLYRRGNNMKKPTNYELFISERNESINNHYNGKREPSEEEIKRREVTHINHPSKKSICKILKEHSKDLKNDTEHLSTDFLQNLIGVECQSKEDVIDILKRNGLGKNRRKKMLDYSTAKRICFEGLFIDTTVYDNHIEWICEYLKI